MTSCSPSPCSSCRCYTEGQCREGSSWLSSLCHLVTPYDPLLVLSLLHPHLFLQVHNRGSSTRHIGYKGAGVAKTQRQMYVIYQTKPNHTNSVLGFCVQIRTKKKASPILQVDHSGGHTSIGNTPGSPGVQNPTKVRDILTDYLAKLFR